MGISLWDAAMSQVGALSVKIGVDTADFRKGIDDAKKRLTEFTVTTDDVKKGLLAVAAAGAAVATATAALVRNAINVADQMGKAASKIGITTEELSKLQYAAELSGVEAGTLQSSLNRLTIGMSEAAQGSGQANDAFRALGITVKNQDGTLRSSTDVMGDLADQFSNMRDSSEKTALAIRIFGKAGADMIPLLNGGRDAIKNAGNELERLGGVVTAKAAQQAAQFNDNITRLIKTVSGFAMQLANSVLPTLVNFTNRMNAAIQSNLGFWRSMKLIFTADDERKIEELNKRLEDLANRNRSRSSAGQKSRQLEIDQINEEIRTRKALINQREQEAAQLMGRALATAPTIVSEDKTKKERVLMDEHVLAYLAHMEEIKKAEDARIQQLSQRVTALQVSLATEREQEMFHHEQRMAILEQARLDELIADEEYAETKLRAEQFLQDRLTEIAVKGMTERQKFLRQSNFDQAKEIFGHMVQITSGVAQHNKTLFNLNKASGIANAVINAYEGISKTLARYPYPVSIAMAALQGAAAFAQVRAIASQSFNGTSAGGAAAAPALAGSTAATPVSPVAGAAFGGGQMVNINLQGEIFGREQVRGLIGQINEAISDGAVLRVQ